MNKRTFGYSVFFIFSAILILTIPAFTIGNEDYKVTNKEHFEETAIKAPLEATISTPLILVEEKSVQAAPRVKKAQASAKYPYILKIPSIAVNAGVKAMGVEKDGRMAVPDNYTEVGWYSLGTKPGNEGSAVMGAHVDNGSSVSGVFKKLHTLDVGDSVFITNAGGKEMHFKVTHTKVYDRNETVTTDVWHSNNGAHLNLITCYGTWLPSENTYEKRIIIYTELVK
jgi:sortase A